MPQLLVSQILRQETEDSERLRSFEKDKLISIWFVYFRNSGSCFLFYCDVS
jgi:hypothetical protein